MISDPTDPLATLGIVFSVNDAETLPPSLTVSATSSNVAVVTNANLFLSGASNLRTLTITPSGVGYSTITVSVSDGVNTTNYTINYAASAAATTPSLTRFHIGRSDASTAVQIDADYMFVADDENQALRLYNRNQSGISLNAFDYTTSLGLTDISGGIPREVDIESSTKLGNRIFWLGSHDNSSSGNNRPNRSRVFATDISGTGSTSTLSYVGRYDGLKTDLLAWDQSNGHGLGADYFGLVASAAAGVIPEALDGSGFNIEGLVMAPDNSTAYIGFRAPIVPVTSRTKALVVPVTNFTSLFSANPTTGTNAIFGTPIQLDLGGRGIREIKKNASGQYLIIAGPFATSNDIAPTNFVLYAWSGNAADAPLALSSSLSSNSLNGSFEGIVNVPDPLVNNASVQLVVDNGDAVYYNDALIAKDLTESNFKKATSTLVTISGYVATPIINSSLVAQTFTGLSFSYAITALNSPASFSATGLPAGLTLNASGIISGTPTTAGTYSISISATNASGTDTETLLLTVTSGFMLTEIFINPPSTDDGQETIEIEGAPNTSLAGISLLVIEGDATTAGLEDLRIDLSAYSTGSNGLLLIRDASTTLLPAPDAGTSVIVLDFNPDIENGTNTFILGAGTAPALNSDLDSDNDGTFNVGALNGFTAMDAVSIRENDGAANFAYADDLGFTVLGPFSGFNPDALYRTFNFDETTCIWTGGDLLGSVGGPYTFDFAANRIFGFQEHGISSGVDLNLGTANQLFDTDVDGIANACEPLTVSGVVTNETCTNLDNGLITLQVFGGTYPYTFAWSNGSTDRSPDSLNANVYSVTVTDFVGATHLQSFSVNAGAVPTTWYADGDGDTYGAGAAILACIQPANTSTNNTDCNDGVAAINPAATEICNSIDDNCDGSIDEGVTLTFYADGDGDTYGNATVTTTGCYPAPGFVLDNSDCNDANVAVNPAATEVCNGIDDDCDGDVDANDSDIPVQNWYSDVDGDGFGDASGTATISGCPVAGKVNNNSDCDDGVATVNPAATEVCDNIDNDCDGLTDEGVTLTFYADADGDTYGNATVTTTGCSPAFGYVLNNSDCNDANIAVNPAATEICNTIDDDCDGSIDEGVTLTFYADSDGDTYGAGAAILACIQPANTSTNNTDCNDGVAAINPAATEICDNIDNDCDGLTDEGVQSTFYADGDGDTYGNALVTISSCSMPLGYVANNQDCNDNIAAINPTTSWYLDADNDNYYIGSATVQCASPGVGYKYTGLVAGGDCNDAVGAINPGASEICANSIDDDCDGLIDEGCNNFTYYQDLDNDTYGNASVFITSSNPIPPAGYVSNSNDCNDNNAGINPGAAEICNSIDDDCDGLTDEGLTQITASITATGGQFSFCPGTSVVINAVPAALGNTFLWSNGATTPSISVNSPGSFSVTITNASGCTSIAPTVNVIKRYRTSDFNQDGITDVVDFLSMLAFFNQSCTACPQDISNDGVVNVVDYLSFLSEFGLSCQ